MELEKKRIEINKIINGKGDSTTDTIEIQKIITGNYKRDRKSVV